MKTSLQDSITNGPLQLFPFNTLFLMFFLFSFLSTSSFSYDQKEVEFRNNFSHLFKLLNQGVNEELNKINEEEKANTLSLQHTHINPQKSPSLTTNERKLYEANELLKKAKSLNFSLCSLFQDTLDLPVKTSKQKYKKKIKSIRKSLEHESKEDQIINIQLTSTEIKFTIPAPRPIHDLLQQISFKGENYITNLKKNLIQGLKHLSNQKDLLDGVKKQLESIPQTRN